MVDMLNKLKSLQKNIKVAIIGTGSAGKGLVYQCSITPGIDCLAISDVKINKAIAAATLTGQEFQVVENLNDLHDTIRKGLLAVCDNSALLAQCELMDALIESSNAIEEGGGYAVTALENCKHVIMMNSESDLIFGPYLMRLAHKNNVVYTSCDGDQPTVIVRLVNELQLWGFELVLAGNIKGFLDRYSDPTKIIPEADKRFLDHKMCASYTDGTKLCVEMALVANALGMEVDVPGMHGPRANDILDALELFDLEGFRRSGRKIVDYVIGPEPKGGVFAIGYCDNKYQQSMLNWFPNRMGKGPFYVFRRPYHLVHIEALQCVAEAVLDGDSVLQPSAGFKTNVYCYAKRNITKGEKLDGLGGYTCYGLIENCGDNCERPGMPICLAEDVTVKRDIAKDEKIYMDDIEYNPEHYSFRLYAKAAEKSREMGK